MEKRKLTKEDLDKVRNIDGFPIGTDEDIIALSDPPYYTACPNPFIEDFIKENGTPYDEATDDYHCEPYAADVSEGKHDPMYMAHSYHTKVPFKAIMRYIFNYTRPGDIVLDGFCGSGMTGVAAQMCGSVNREMQFDFNQDIPLLEFGKRYAILSDLSPEATFLSYNFNVQFPINDFDSSAKYILSECHKECDWMYETTNNGVRGTIEYTVWSDVYICNSCGAVLNLWEISVLQDNKVVEKPKCPHCQAMIDKNKCEHAQDVYFDDRLKTTITTARQVPVKIFYSCGKKRLSKVVDDGDIEIIKRIDSITIPYWYPIDEIPFGYNTEQPKKSHGLKNIYQFYTKRNLYVLAKCFDMIQKEKNARIRRILMFWFSSIYSRSHKLNRYMPNHNRHVGPLSGTLYMPYFQAEINILNLLEDKLSAIEAMYGVKTDAIITSQSTTELKNIPNKSIDYIFTDPPFGDNLMYSELNFIWESWLKVKTNNKCEAIINDSQKKGLHEYQELMTKCFCEYYRVLKPNRWMTVEFHNSKNAVWNAIQEAILRAGFVIADVRTLDKQKGTTKQLSSSLAVKQDLVISAYKPKESLKRKMLSEAGSEETAWAFVRQHLENLPVVVVKNNKIEVISERQAYLLFDRMVAYHIMQGLPVPIDAGDFYKGLKTRNELLERDGMYFLSNQVNEYDAVRVKTDLENIDFSLFVTNEKSAIGWLYRQLSEKDGNAPQTYAELQPKFMQELKAVDKYEAIPELSVLLQDNFLKDDETGKWRIPDPTKEADVRKLREKNLLKEFETYRASKGKLKSFRSEAIRVGFAHLWKEKNYNAIVEMGKRLPESIIQEDSKLLMYYDNSLSKVDTYHSGEQMKLKIEDC